MCRAFGGSLFWPTLQNPVLNAGYLSGKNNQRIRAVRQRQHVSESSDLRLTLWGDQEVVEGFEAEDHRLILQDQSAAC